MKQSTCRSSRGNIEQNCVKFVLTWLFIELHDIPVQQYCLQYQPLGYAVSDWPPVSLRAASHHPVSLAAQPSTHPTAHPPRSYFTIVPMMMFKEILLKACLKLKQCPLIFHHPPRCLSFVLEPTCWLLLFIYFSYAWKWIIGLFAPSLSQGLWWGLPDSSSWILFLALPGEGGHIWSRSVVRNLPQ